MKKEISIIFSVIFLTLSLISLSIATPSGGTISVESSERTPGGQASNHSAIAGNITEITIFSGSGGSQSWQGYYGNVSGGLNIGDGSDNIMYNWSATTPTGEVYASTNSSITWANLQCFNFSASGTYTDESGNGGGTNQNGTNASILETEYGFSPTDIDGMNETFATNNHDLFYSSSLEFSADECRSFQLFNNESESEDGRFEEIIMYEPVSRSVVFTSILEESRLGFNNKEVDFQMLVPEDGHGADTQTTTYFFFIEIG
jgi:hypothetical protein